MPVAFTASIPPSAGLCHVVLHHPAIVKWSRLSSVFELRKDQERYASTRLITRAEYIPFTCPRSTVSSFAGSPSEPPHLRVPPAASHRRALACRPGVDGGRTRRPRGWRWHRRRRLRWWRSHDHFLPRWIRVPYQGLEIRPTEGRCLLPSNSGARGSGAWRPRHRDSNGR